MISVAFQRVSKNVRGPFVAGEQTRLDVVSLVSVSSVSACRFTLVNTFLKVNNRPNPTGQPRRSVAQTSSDLIR